MKTILFLLDQHLQDNQQKDIDWDSVSEDGIFVDYPEDVDQEEII